MDKPEYLTETYQSKFKFMRRAYERLLDKITLWELRNGKTVVFANEDEMDDPRAIVRLFELTHADAINGTPSRYLHYFEYPQIWQTLRTQNIFLSAVLC